MIDSFLWWFVLGIRPDHDTHDTGQEDSCGYKGDCIGCSFSSFKSILSGVFGLVYDSEITKTDGN
jgi:hypothetical protein